MEERIDRRQEDADNLPVGGDGPTESSTTLSARSESLFWSIRTLHEGVPEKKKTASRATRRGFPQGLVSRKLQPIRFSILSLFESVVSVSDYFAQKPPGRKSASTISDH